MEENAWQAIGRIARMRREALGRKQGELELHGGPGVATVGKFERAAQPSFPGRTQNQMESALGWPKGAIADFIAAAESGSDALEELEEVLLTEPAEPTASQHEPDSPETRQAIDALAGIVRLVEPTRLGDAVRDGVSAMLPYLSVTGATELGSRLRADYPPKGGVGNADADAGGPASTNRDDYELIAHEEEHTIESEQGHDETP